LTLILLAAIWLADARSTARADQPVGPPWVEGVRVGFDGKFKVGLWTPVAVTLRGGEHDVRGRLQITVPDGDGIKTRVTTEGPEPVVLPAGRETTFVVYAKIGRVGGVLSVGFLDDDGRPAGPSFSCKIPEPALATQELIVTLGDDVGVAEAIGTRRREKANKPVLAPVLRVEDLPDRWWGYAGVDTFVMTTGNMQHCGAMTDDQIAALNRWVQLGGRFVLCVGANGEKLLGRDGRMACFVPGRFDRVTRQRETSGLETYVGAGRIDEAGAGRRLQLDMSVVDDVHGRVEVYEGTDRSDRPVIIRAPHGFGQIVFVAVDLDREPFTGWNESRTRRVAKWNGRTRLVAKLLQKATGSSSEDSDERVGGQVAHVGYKDLVGQLRAALDQFTGVRFVPFSVVAALIVIYIALIGPIDYFFLRKVVRRMEWTWMTFPLVVLAFCALAWYLAGWSKGSRLRINQVDVVDVDVESSLVRGTMWAHLYSPRTESYDLTLATRLPVPGEATSAGTLISWHGLPGTALGGMNRAARADLFGESYAISSCTDADRVQHMAISGLPIQVWSSKSLVGRWRGRAGGGVWQGHLRADSVGLVRGEVVNPLTVPLDDCVLFHGRWAYPLGKVGPRQRVAVDKGPGPRNVETLLRQRKIIDGKDINTPWDPSSDDVPRIIQIMMFHEAAGGRTYTTLFHRYQGFIDLSDHLKTGRAVLVGRAGRRATELVRGGTPLSDEYDKHWTFYRFVFPVEPAGNERR